MGASGRLWFVLLSLSLLQLALTMKSRHHKAHSVDAYVIDTTYKEWVVIGQKTVFETAETFDRATVALTSFKKQKYPKLAKLSKYAARLAGSLGVFSAIFSMVLAFLPGADSAEIKYMKTEFGKLGQKIDTVSRSLQDTKELIKLATQKSAYVRYEQKIHHGFTHLQACIDRLGNVTCSDLKDCQHKKHLVAEGYVQSLNIKESIDAILLGVTTNSVFGKAMLDLLKKDSKCNIPKINFFTNKITALVMQGYTVSIFHDLITKSDYNDMDHTVLAQKIINKLESKRQAIQDSCFQTMAYWMSLDVKDATKGFLSDIQATNTKLLQTLKMKYPWIYWHVITYKGDKEPVVGPSGSSRRHLHSTSKTLKVHSFIIPTNDAEVENMDMKVESWKEITTKIDVKDDMTGEVTDLEKQVKKDAVIEDKIQSFAILVGEGWVLGHYKDKIKQHTLGLANVSSMNVFVDRPIPTKGFIVAVSFNAGKYPPTCSNQCNGQGECYVYPYSTRTGCKCKLGHYGDTCNSTEIKLKLKSVINSLLQHTMKLPTFASIQQSIGATQLYLKASTHNIQDSIVKLGNKIERSIKNLGEFMSNKLDWFSLLLKYKDAIDNLNYFHSLSNEGFIRTLQNVSTNQTGNAVKDRLSDMEQRDIALYLLTPTGIHKWLYQLNFLIVGRQDSQLNSHKPLLLIVMEKYKDRICNPDYKNEITRTFRQLMLLQLQGYVLWSNAYDAVNRDSSAVADRYKHVLASQQEYLRNTTCSVSIAHSRNFNNCTDGYFVHRSMPFTVSCENGYFRKGLL